MRSIFSKLFIAATLSLQSLCADRLCAVQFAGGGVSARISETSFDKGNFGKLTLIAARKKAEDALQAHLMLIEKATVLTDAQRSKLDLAGQIDIHRFFADYASAKRKMNFGTVPRNELQAKFAEMQILAQPMAARYASGLHGESSLLAKTLDTILQTDQSENVAELFQEREKLLYVNYVRMTLAMIDQRVPLTQRERSTITTLLLSKTAPPESYGSSAMPLFQVLYQMAQIEDELQELFSDDEAVVISQLIQAGKTAVENQ